MKYWASESDIQGFVKIVLQGAIREAGLQGKLHCFNELSVFELRPDIWIVKHQTGVDYMGNIYQLHIHCLYRCACGGGGDQNTGFIRYFEFKKCCWAVI